jgi:hypothetical protein
MVDRDDIRDAQSRQADSHGRALDELDQLGNLINDLEDAAPEDDVDLSWVKDFYEENAQNYDTISQFAEDLKTEVEDRVDDNSDVYLSVVDGYGIDDDRRDLLKSVGLVAGSAILGGSGIISALILDEDDDTSSSTSTSTNTSQTRQSAVDYTVPAENLGETIDLMDEYVGGQDAGIPMSEKLWDKVTNGKGVEVSEITLQYIPGENSNGNRIEDDSRLGIGIGEDGRVEKTFRKTVEDDLAGGILAYNQNIDDFKGPEEYRSQVLENPDKTYEELLR